MNPFTVTLNNQITLNDNISGWFLDKVAPILGLGMADIRTSQKNYAGRNGGFISQQFFGVRPITVNAHYFASDAATVATARRALETAVGNVGVSFPLTVTTFDGRTYYMDVYLVKFDMDYNNIKNQAIAKLELVATDPYIYDISSGSLISVPIGLIKDGGYIMPYILPVVWAAGTTPTAVTNGGAVPINPVITITGAVTNPTIKNNTTGKLLQLSPLTTTSTDVIVIDMKNHTITLNGGSILALKTTSSNWWSLQTGLNQVSFITTNAGDTGTAVLTYRNAYLGV